MLLQLLDEHDQKEIFSHNDSSILTALLFYHWNRTHQYIFPDDLCLSQVGTVLEIFEFLRSAI